MIRRLSKLVGIILAVFGLYQVYDVLAEKTGHELFSIIIISTIAIIWILYEFIRNIYNPFVFRFFNTEPIVDTLITNIKIELFINEKGDAISHSYRTYIFEKSPKVWETYDTLFVKGEFSGNIGDYYESNDAVVTSFKRLANNKILVFWRPKETQIKPHVPYKHHYIYRPPSNFNDDANFYLLYKICPVGLLEFIAHTYRPVKDVWAIEISSHERTINEEHAKLLVEKTQEFSIPQPKKTNDGFCWKAYGTEFEKPILIYFTYMRENSNKKINTDAEIAPAISEPVI